MHRRLQTHRRRPFRILPTPPTAEPEVPRTLDASTTSVPGRSLFKRKWAYVAGGVGLLLIIGAAASARSDDETAGRNDDQAVEARSTSTSDGADSDLVVRTQLIEPPDEAGYLDGVRKREPAASDQLDSSTLIDFGLRSCALRDGYVTGSRPDTIQLLAEDLADEVGGLDPDDVASAVANAAQGKLCDATYEEAG